MESKKEDSISMEQYLKDLKDTINQLEALDMIIPKALTVLLLLNSLPKEYLYFSKSMIGKPSLLGFVEIECRLLDEEM